LCERCRGRRIEPAQRCRVGDTPAGEIEREWRKVCDQDLRRRLRRQRTLRALGPQSIIDTGRRAARAASALIGRCTRDRQGFEPAHAGVRIEALATFESAIDDDTHTLDRETRFGDVGGHDDFAPAGRRRPQCEVLCGGVEVAVQRQHHQCGIARRLGDRRHGPPDLGRTRQEGEHVAGRRL
jgi:hypothetical protein